MSVHVSLLLLTSMNEKGTRTIAMGNIRTPLIAAVSRIPEQVRAALLHIAREGSVNGLFLVK